MVSAVDMTHLIHCLGILLVVVGVGCMVGAGARGAGLLADGWRGAARCEFNMRG